MRPFDQLNVMYINWWMIGLIELISCRISLPSFPGFPEVEVRAYVPRDRAGPYYGHVHTPYTACTTFSPESICAAHRKFLFHRYEFLSATPSCKKTGPQNQGFQKPKQKSEITFQSNFWNISPTTCIQQAKLLIHFWRTTFKCFCFITIWLLSPCISHWKSDTWPEIRKCNALFENFIISFLDPLKCKEIASTYAGVHSGGSLAFQEVCVRKTANKVLLHFQDIETPFHLESGISFPSNNTSNK